MYLNTILNKEVYVHQSHVLKTRGNQIMFWKNWFINFSIICWWYHL